MIGDLPLAAAVILLVCTLVFAGYSRGREHAHRADIAPLVQERRAANARARDAEDRARFAEHEAARLRAKVFRLNRRLARLMRNTPTEPRP